MVEETRTRVPSRRQISQALQERAGPAVACEFETLLDQGRKLAALKLARAHGIRPDH